MSIQQLSIQAPDFTCPNCNIPFGEDFFPLTAGVKRYSLGQGEDRVTFDLCSKCASKGLNSKRMGIVFRRVKKNPDEYLRGEIK